MVVKKDTLIILHILKKLPDLSVYSLNLTLINQVVMSNKISRRKFIADTGKATAAVAGTVALQGMTFPSILDPKADIAVVNGSDYFKSTLKAIDLLGGMGKFVNEGAHVGLLINSDFDVEGAYVDPDISIAAIKMLWDAGATKITCLQVVKEEYWQRSNLFEEYKDLISKLDQVESNTFPSEYNETDFIKLKNVPAWKSLKETEVVRSWLECDVFVNIPVSKHHATTQLTCALKNIMGVSTRQANVTFHLGSGERNNPDYLAQCIVDQYMMKKTDLCIIDSTNFITDNGPSGPGTIKTLNKVIAGTDVVALDAMTSEFLDLYPEDVYTTVKAHESGIGDMDYQKLKIVEVNV